MRRTRDARSAWREVASRAGEVRVDRAGGPASREEDMAAEKTVWGSGEGRGATRRPRDATTCRKEGAKGSPKVMAMSRRRRGRRGGRGSSEALRERGGWRCWLCGPEAGLYVSEVFPGLANQPLHARPYKDPRYPVKINLTLR